LSPERFGQDLGDVLQVAQRMLSEAQIDYLDMSLWDVFKEPEDERYRGRSLLSYFTELERGKVRLGVAGKLIQPADIVRCFNNGVDFVILGKVAILHKDYPSRMETEREFMANWLPVTADYLRDQGLGEKFIAYLSTWTNFISDQPPPKDAPRFDIEEYLKKGTSGKKSA
jgi:2,4-dienoyl-CoA reductase-like NADH-dependent reductase (Old Yellow Enzyme family)